MAKNLKLNIKNAQLAEALKLSPPKKILAKKPLKESEETILEQKVHEESITPVIEQSAPAVEIQPKELEAQNVFLSPEIERQEVMAEEPAPSPTPVKKILTTSYRNDAPRQQDFVRKPFSASGQETASPVKQEVTPHVRKEGFTYPVKREPGYVPPRREGTSFPVRKEGFTYPVKREGSTFPVKRDGAAPFPARKEGFTYPVKRDGAAPFPARREGFSSPRPPFRPGAPGEFRPGRQTLPPIKEPAKELPQQQQQYKKPTTHHAPDKDSKLIKKASDNRTFDVRDRQGLRDGDDTRWRKRRPIKTKQELQDEIIRPKELKIRLPVTVKDLAVAMKLKASQLIAKLFMQGTVLTLNDCLDDETTVQLLGNEFDCAITIDTSEEERIRITGKSIKEEISSTDATLLQLRPPVVAFMGHVDHGKTSLIDKIRTSNVAHSEAGAITQHIGAFKCETPVGIITILDTPGHEAFSSMRERGADVTDIVVLVVAGDEGIKTQTLEAIRQAQDAGVCLVVAINKCDKPNFDAETVYRQLADQNLLPEVWGGSVITVNCSAATGEGVKELLEMLALQSEILELKANPAERARGTVIESEMHKGLGPVATILVQNGTLRSGDSLVFDELYARVKTMHDEHGKELLEAGPSTPVKITGLSGIPAAGGEFIVVKNEKEAKEISEKREGQRGSLLLQVKKASLENLLQNKADSGTKKTLKLIIKADVQGSLEALKTSLRKLPSQKVDILFISEGVGEISESDIQFAATSKAIILGFHTGIESHAESLIKQNKVDVRLHDIIYHAVDDVKAVMLNLLDKIPQENELGAAVVKAVFKSSQLGNIAGCQVVEGLIRRNCHAKLIRNKEVIWKGPIASLKKVKEDVKEVSKGHECGILLQGFTDYKEDDRIQAFEITYLQQELT
ncbi:MAG: translation initiation factor IF-2 [Chlamydiota bacterium]